jgi:hypothetical protein
MIFIWHDSHLLQRTVSLILLMMSRPDRRSRRHERSSSTLSGMFPAGEESMEMLSSGQKETSSSSINGRESMKDITRKLRRAKRQLLLKSVQKPASPVDQLRGMILQLSVESMDFDTDEISSRESVTFSTNRLDPNLE